MVNYDIYLSVPARECQHPRVFVSQNDTFRNITATIVNEVGTQPPIPEGSEAFVYGLLPSGECIIRACETRDDNKITFPISEAFTAQAGRVWCSFRIVDATGHSVSPTSFYINVEPSPGQDGAT